MVDLSILHGIQPENTLCAPVLLMSALTPEKRLYSLPDTCPVPLAIKLNPTPKYPVIMPHNTNWFQAKLFFNCSDVNYHEAITHLLKSHLNAEAFAAVTVTELDEDHPIRKLLFPHFHFTISINAAARVLLTGKGGAFDDFFSLRADGLDRVNTG
jgi:hypothetical protein